MTKFEESEWSLQAIIAWIRFRDPQCVDDLAALGDPSNHAIDAVGVYAFQNRDLLSCAGLPLREDLAIAELERAYRSGEVTVWGRWLDGEAKQIPSADLSSLVVDLSTMKLRPQGFNPYRNGPGWSDPRFPRTKALERWRVPPAQTLAVTSEISSDQVAGGNAEATPAPTPPEADAPGTAAEPNAANHVAPLTKRRERATRKKQMYETWFSLVAEYRLKDDGTAHTRERVAQKIAADNRAKDPMTKKQPSHTSVIRRLDEHHPAWFTEARKS